MKNVWLMGAIGLLFVGTCFGADALPDSALPDSALPDTETVGKPAPDFTMTGIDGKPFQLSDITGSGKNVALMFSRAHW